MHSSFFSDFENSRKKQVVCFFMGMLWEESMETNLVNKKRTMYNKGRKHLEEKI